MPADSWGTQSSGSLRGSHWEGEESHLQLQGVKEWILNAGCTPPLLSHLQELRTRSCPQDLSLSMSLVPSGLGLAVQTALGIQGLPCRPSSSFAQLCPSVEQGEEVGLAHLEKAGCNQSAWITWSCFSVQQNCEQKATGLLCMLHELGDDGQKLWYLSYSSS